MNASANTGVLGSDGSSDRRISSQSSAFRISNLTGLYINAEGKCGSKAAMQAILRAAWDVDSSAKVIVVAECDFRRSEDEESYDFWYRKCCWAVTRHKLHQGRAMKIFIAKEIERNLTCFKRLRRSVVLGFKASIDEITVVASHFGHGEAWEESALETVEHISDTYSKAILLGDLNVESRSDMQGPDDSNRWRFLVSLLEGQGLVQQDLGVEFSRRGKRESETDSLIDHVFVGHKLSPSCSATWDGAPGDHCWLRWACGFRVSLARQPARRWHCDWDEVCQFLSSETPDIFGTWGTAEKWMAEVVERFAIKSPRRERRRNWEPFSIKLMRWQVKNAANDTEKNDLCCGVADFRQRA